MNLDLRHLEIVCSIAEHGSVSRAAAALGLAQPAVSRQLRRIEQNLGGSLFTRDHHGARPTTLGELVLSRARVVLPAVQDLQEEATRVAASGQPARFHRIGTVSSPLLSGLLHRLTVEQPEVRVGIHYALGLPELAEPLHLGALDFVLAGLCGNAVPPLGHELAWQVFAVDAVWVLLPEAHPLAKRPEIELADLADAQWVAGPGDSCFGDCFAAACARAGFTPRAFFESDVRTCVELSEAGDAVTLCQSTFRPPAGMVTVPLAGAPLRWRHLLGWRPDAPVAGFADTILRYGLDTYRDLVARLPHLATWLERHPDFGITAASDSR